MFNNWFNSKGNIVNIQAPINNNFNLTQTTMSATTSSFGWFSPSTELKRKERRSKYKKLFNE